MQQLIFPIITETEAALPFYLTGVGILYHQEHIKRMEGYPDFQWIQCHRGEGKLVLAEGSYAVRPGQGMFLFPDEIHEYYETRSPWEVDWISFQGDGVRQMTETTGIRGSGVLEITNAEVLLAKIRRSLAIARSHDPFKGMECSGIIYELLLDLLQYSSRGNETSVRQQYFRLRPVFDYIEKNYAQMVSLQELADTLGVTPQHLCILFKNYLKVRPFEYLNQVRINKSKDLIVSDRKLEIQRISSLVGFEHPSYFCSVFKRLEGISPGQFRKLHGI